MTTARRSRAARWHRTFIPAAVGLLLLAGSPDLASGQLSRLKKAAGDLAGKTPNVSSLLEGEPPITTSLPDAQFEIDTLDGTNPTEFAALTSLERTANGGFVLEPGLYAMQTQSYCLKAGTYAPGAGDGYLYAPPAGPATDAVVAILRNSVRQTAIPQHDIQVLLWAIIARAKFEDLAPELKVTAAQLLDEKQIAMLNRTALDLVPGPAMDAALAEAPPLVRQVLEAEARLRQMLTSPGTSFAELERVAVLAGMAPVGEGSRNVPSGRWSLHPDGYYVRYLPSGYSSTRVEIWVPQGSPAVGKEYDPATHIAVPGNTARQRLIQSGRAQTQT